MTGSRGDGANGIGTGGERRPRAGPGWRRGIVRLAVTLAAFAAVLAAGGALILATRGVHVFLTGMLLLVGGYLALGGLAIAADWIGRGFRGETPRRRAP